MTTNPARQPKGIRVGGRFANKTNSVSPKSLDVSAAEASPPDKGRDVEAMSMALGKLREARDEAVDNNNPEHVFLDQQVQRASVQLAAVSVRNRYPDAQTLVLRENEDGENQYDVLGVHDNLGYPVPGTGSGSDWTRDEVAGENSIDLEELSWALNPGDDTWAAGIAEITTTREYGKTAKVDINAALAMPAPQPAASKAELLERYEDTREATAEARRQHRQASDVAQNAAVQLAAASMLERYPEADTLHLEENTDEPGGEIYVQSISGPGGEIAHSSDGDDFQYEPGEDGTPDVSELLRGFSTSSMAWCEGIAEVKTDKFNGHQVALNLNSALAQRPLSKPEMVQRYEETQDAAAEARRQHRGARDVDQHASVQLAAASILERYPEADTLHLTEGFDEPGGAMYVHSVSGPGGEIVHSNDGDDFQYESGEDGTPDLSELFRDVDTSSMAWCEGISAVQTDSFTGHRVALNLRAALAKPAPMIEDGDH